MLKRFLTTITLLAAAFGLTGCYTQIDTGNVGVVSVAGQVKDKVLPADWYFSPFQTITEVCAKEMPLQLNDMKPQTSDKITLADLDVDVFVQINPGAAATIMTKWAGDQMEVEKEGCIRVGHGFLARQAREAIYDGATKFNSATIHTERTAIAARVVKDLQANLDAEAGKGLFTVRSANVRNLLTDPALEANIKAAANAQFQLQAEKQQLEVTKVQAERLREAARGEADAIRIKAEAVAKQGGAEYVQLQAIAKWNGALPTTSAGGAVPFINVK